MIRKHFLTYLALSTVGISQPLLDLYGKNGTVFSTAKLSPLEVVVFLVVVALGPAVAAVSLDRFSKFFGPNRWFLFSFRLGHCTVGPYFWRCADVGALWCYRTCGAYCI